MEVVVTVLSALCWEKGTGLFFLPSITRARPALFLSSRAISTVTANSTSLLLIFRSTVLASCWEMAPALLRLLLTTPQIFRTNYRSGIATTIEYPIWSQREMEGD